MTATSVDLDQRLALSGARIGGHLVRGGTLLCLLLGFALSLPLLDRYPLRPDEALYGFWALTLRYHDPLLLQVWPDKPPLYLWLLSAALEGFGGSAAGARWLNIATTTLTVGGVAAIARRQWGATAGLWAALTYALNPFALSFAPTAYTDPLMVLWGTLALWAVLAGHPTRAGLCLGAAIITKQPALFYIPLAMGGLLWAAPKRYRWAPAVARLGLGTAMVLLPVLFWDSLRWSVAPSPWDLATLHYAPLSLLPVSTWWPRLQSWSQLLWYLTASTAAWVLLGLGGLATLVWNARARARSVTEPGHAGQQIRLVALLSAWSTLLVTLHLAGSFPVWDRYLLPLAPMVALLVGWISSHSRKLSPPIALLLGLAWSAILAGPAWQAARGGLPLGGDRGDYAGLDAAVAWLQSNAPANGVIYHQDLGWQLQFYLFEQVGSDGYELRWYPSPIYLANNAAKVPHRRKFVLVPEWSRARDMGRQAAMRGLGWQRQLRAGRLTLYELTLPTPTYCNWCLCRPPGWATTLTGSSPP